ncbi:PREDICTED: ATP synthase subunit d, mitochondrial-like [Odobenus rosmarus divergens]|uniref:ATP synthase subunit d, mitochondrial-like n=1 Tax=Odobenus rosmarus divergens TaxID=9708 RepID=A0A9B0GZ29_ODORO
MDFSETQYEKYNEIVLDSNLLVKRYHLSSFGVVLKTNIHSYLKRLFNALKVPVPEDKYTVQVDPEEKEDVKSCAEFLSLSKARIEEYEKGLEKMRNIIPFDQMTIEDLNEVFPETKLDKKYPYWPHKPSENL